MLCPHCKVELKIADRQGIEIDYCPQCRGVWLDRGELDKILERSATMPTAPQGSYGPPAGYPAGPRGGWRRDDDDDDWDDDDERRRRYGQPGYPQPGYGQPGYGQYGYPRRKKSWLSEIFDFD